MLRIYLQSLPVYLASSSLSVSLSKVWVLCGITNRYVCFSAAKLNFSWPLEPLISFRFGSTTTSVSGWLPNSHKPLTDYFFRSLSLSEGHTFAQARAELASHGAKAYFTRGSQVWDYNLTLKLLLVPFSSSWFFPLRMCFYTSLLLLSRFHQIHYLLIFVTSNYFAFTVLQLDQFAEREGDTKPSQDSQGGHCRSRRILAWDWHLPQGIRQCLVAWPIPCSF